MTEINVGAGGGYPIITERGIISRCGSFIRRFLGGKRIMIVSDGNVYPLYGEAVAKSLTDGGFEVSAFVFEAGECNKNSDTYLSIISELAKEGFKRDGIILALGGGVTGDMAGFAAATYMRGIKLVQMPTTLLAAIDSSIGGKTGVNLPEGKNLLGAFYQPECVLFDVDALKTLPREERKNGMGEGIKYAIIEGGRLFRLIADNAFDENAEEFIGLCQQSKADIVSRDERENGPRKLLNLGHTVGHAIEKVSGLEVSHGKAVACGIGIMAQAATAAGELSKAECGKVIEMLTENGFDTESVWAWSDLKQYVKRDKKGGGTDMISVVKIFGIGDVRVEDMPYSRLEDYLKGSGRII